MIIQQTLFDIISKDWNEKDLKPIKFVDLFCGIGGFRIATEEVLSKYGIDFECVFSCDNDKFVQKSYYANFGEHPAGDITKVESNEIPDHDVLFAGFPCQPFSIIGRGKGFEDTRGTLFFEIARILEQKKPKAFILENVKQLVGHRNGATLKKIIQTLKDLGYYVEYKVLNALDYGLPQKRERVFIVGFHKPMWFSWPPRVIKRTLLKDILETNIDLKYYVSERIRKKRHDMHKSNFNPAIWHENKSGNISSYPYSCALRAGASYNYLLVNGERRFTPSELLRLQGFPEHYKIVVPDTQIRKQTGNAVPVNVVKAVVEAFLPIILEDNLRNECRHII